MTRPKGRAVATASRIPYQFPPSWTGITSGHNAMCSCTWGYNAGQPEIKFVHRACIVHGGVFRG